MECRETHQKSMCASCQRKRISLYSIIAKVWQVTALHGETRDSGIQHDHEPLEESCAGAVAGVTYDLLMLKQLDIARDKSQHRDRIMWGIGKHFVSAINWH